MRFLGALLITYFVSRLLRRLGLAHPPLARLVAAHGLSFVLIAVLVIALRYPIGAFAPGQLAVYAAAQLLWLLLDGFRSEVRLGRSTRRS